MRTVSDASRIGIYVHIPFCVKKCEYCDFLSFPEGAFGRDRKEQYLRALGEEIDAARLQDGPGDFVADSVFFGGGTPSLLEPKQIESILCKLKSVYRFSDDCEISMEVNPGTVDIKSLSGYRAAGVNRLSVGAQSMNDQELALLGRIHDRDRFLATFRDARAAGFDNVNVDLMSALPGQSPASFARSLSEVIDLAPEHLSVYSLILEEGTPLYAKRDRLNFPGEDEIDEIDRITLDLTAKAGYGRYEISNYAKSGRECRHNVRYWKRGYYRGFGLAAASFLPRGEKEIRFTAERDPGRYLADHALPLRERRGAGELRELTREEAMEEFFFLGLRMTEGVSLSEFFRIFGEQPEDRFGSPIQKYTALGFMGRDGDRLFFTERGLSLSTMILADFLL